MKSIAQVPDIVGRGMTYNCASCGERLEQEPEKSTDGWFIRCVACGARNLIISVFKLVDWR